MHALFATLALGLAVAGCKPTFRECAVRCGTNQECPADTRCESDGFCHALDGDDVCEGPGLDDDAGGDPGDPGDPGGPIDACPAPMLLVAIQDLGDSTGRLRRYSLGADGPTRCAGDLSAGGTLQSDVMALAWVPPNHVAVAMQAQILLIDVQTDRVAWTVPVHDDTIGIPIDATVIGSDPPILLVGLFSKQSVGTDVHILETYQLDDGEFIAASTLADEPQRLTRAPEDPTKILTLKSGTFAAAETDPVTGEFAEPAFGRDVPNATLRTIRALFDSPAFVVWAGTPDAARDGIYYLRLGSSTLLGPIRCDAQDRTYVEAAPDPDRGHIGFFAVSELAGEREVVHFRSTGGCATIVSSTSLAPNQRIGALGVIEQ